MSGGHGCVRQDPHLLVWVNGAQLPDRCVLCNGPAQGYRVTKTFYWHEPLVYAALLGGVLIYGIIALIVRKTATVSYGLCAEHKQRRTMGLTILWGGLLGGLALLFVAAFAAVGWLALVGLLAMLVGPIVGLVMARTIAPTRIDASFAWLKVGPPFLESMPYAMAPPMAPQPFGYHAPGGYGPPPGGYGPPPGGSGW